MKKGTNPPIDSRIVEKHISQSGLKSVGLASIRELNRLVTNIQQESGVEFIRMEMWSTHQRLNLALKARELSLY